MLEAWYPGVFANGSTTRPAGDQTSIRQVNYTEGLETGHSWYDAQGIKPLFPFGYGLSYTTFAAHPRPLQADEHRPAGGHAG